MSLARPDPDIDGPSIEHGWTLALSPAGAWASPAEAAVGEWWPAVVPGTVAAALERLGRWDRRKPSPLHDQDVWYRTRIAGDGAATLVFEGLATVAEVWLDGVLVARSEAMFTPLDVPVTLGGTHDLVLAFRSLADDLAARKGPRARWRTRMVEDARLRFVRTTMLGHAPGWCPPIHVVGPWRPVRLRQTRTVADVVLRSHLDGADGVVDVALTLPAMTEDDAPRLISGPHATALVRSADGRWRGTLRIEDATLWWPRTHGEPSLHDIALRTTGDDLALGRTGFRDLKVDHGAGGGAFTLLVNGVRVFCRGVCWTPDLVGLGGMRQDCEPVLRTLAAANVNMVRVGGTMIYESAAFHALCDELGILVWQDCMLANFDYPRDEAFALTVRAEVAALLNRTAGSPSLAVLCGGSEIAQQATMMGLPPEAAAHPLFDTDLPAFVAAERSDVAWVPGSPSGGPLPFVTDRGPSHYYGVGAYQRPLEDARLAGVRFASECLAFANVPEDATLRRYGLDPVADPEGWAASIPRDNGASWSFEDTRHHYMARLDRVDPIALRSSDPQRYLDLSRAITAEVTERTFDEWRRPGSVTAGGLVWFGRDLTAGSGWGVVDVDGRPKSNLHAMRRAFAPLRLSITDEGVNGLAVHCVNDGVEPVAGRLSLECLRAGSVRVVQGGRDVVVPARGGLTISAFDLFGYFFDAGCAYPFGEPPHDTVTASLDAGESRLAEAHWVPDHARSVLHDVLPDVSLHSVGDDWHLRLRTGRMLRAVVVADESLVPDDNGFDLGPRRDKIVVLKPLAGAVATPPRGEVRALNLSGAVRYGQAP